MASLLYSLRWSSSQTAHPPSSGRYNQVIVAKTDPGLSPPNRTEEDLKTVAAAPWPQEEQQGKGMSGADAAWRNRRVTTDRTVKIWTICSPHR
jgi:hypothetical protein